MTDLELMVLLAEYEPDWDILVELDDGTRLTLLGLEALPWEGRMAVVIHVTQARVVRLEGGGDG